MVGRDAERERVLAAAARVRGAGGSGRRAARVELVVLRGEAGIGKSTLAAEVADAVAADGFEVRIGRADELSASEAGAVLRQLVGALPPPPHDLEPAQALAELARAFVDRVAEAAAAGPVLLVVEDLHWADVASVLAVDRLVTSRLDAPVLVLATARPVPRTRAVDTLVARIGLLGGELVTLEPLGGPEVERIAAEALDGAGIGPHLRDLLEATGGNPLYVRELLAALDGAGALRTDGGTVDTAGGGRAPALSIAILGHLRSLEPATLELLRLGSVLGGSFTADDVALLTGTAPAILVGTLEEATAAGVLVDVDGRLAFRHHLVRDALYADLTESARRHLHLEVARRLVERGAPDGRVAQHLLRAGGFDRDDVRAMAVDTARSLASLDPSAAADLLLAAHAATPDRLARQGLLADLALCLLWGGRFVEAEPFARDAVAHDLTPTVPGDVHTSLATALAGRARAPEAMRICDEELARERRQGPARTRLAAVRAWSCLLSSDGHRAEVLAREVVETAVVPGETTPWAESLALVTMAMCARLFGRLVEADELSERAALAADRDPFRDAIRNAPLFIVRSSVLVDLDRLEDALDVLDNDRYVPSEVSGIATDAPVSHARALALFHLGRWDEAVEAAEKGMALWRAAGAGHALTSSSVLAMIHTGRGDLVRAERHCAEGEAEFAATRSPHNSTLVRLARARLDAATGRGDRAWSNLAEVWELALALAVRVELPVLGVDLARLADAGGDPSRASFVVGDLDAMRTGNEGLPRVAAAALLARGLVEDDADLLVAALEEYRRGPRPVETARAAVDAAVALARAGRRDEAQGALDDAATAFGAVGAALELRSLEARARQVDLVLRRRRGRGRARTGWEALSPAELEVVRLVAERLTNPEIAQRLYVSPRTVQTHVSHALAKLGVSNRAELAAAAARHAGWRFGVQPATDPGS